MLTWKTQAGKPPLFLAVSNSETSADTQTALSEFWCKLLDETEVYHGNYPWEVIICQIWPDTGRVVGHPAMHRDYEWNNAKVMVQLTVSQWYNESERLPDPDANAAKFERAYGRNFKSIVTSLKKATLDGELKNRFAKFKKNPNFGVFVINAPETIHREKLQLLVGNRLPKLTFQSDIELFEALFRKASTYLQYCSSIEHGKIVCLEFNGRNFKDKILSMLDHVPNLAAMCASLREIRLHATALSSERIERLREQLPHVKVSILSDAEYWSAFNAKHNIDQSSN